MSPSPPVIILVEPQLGDNIGAAARAMLNCGLRELRLVKPRDGWPNERAQSMASGADIVLEEALLFDTFAEAIGDLNRVYATTARRRDMVKHSVTPTGAAEEIHAATAGGERCGVVFGRERIGLTNEEVVLTDAVLTVPLNPEFTSLNLGQAVLLIGWEWRRLKDQTPARQLLETEYRPARREELLELFDHLEKGLESHGFFRVAAKRPATEKTLRNIFLRSSLTDRDVRILHGVVTSLMGRPRGQI